MEILFIQTGGTIDKDYPKTTKGYAFEISTPAFERILTLVNPGFQYNTITAFRKDSLDLAETDRAKLFGICENAVQHKIIITHGTDSMLQTGEYLKTLKNKTIVLTGAMKPERFKDSEAAFNLGMAVGAISYLEPGIYIAMHGFVLPIAEIRRDLKTGKFLSR